MSDHLDQCSSEPSDQVENETIIESKQVSSESNLVQSCAKIEHDRHVGNMGFKIESNANSHAGDARSRYLLAKLKEEQLREELDLENQQRLLKARNDVQFARLEMELLGASDKVVDDNVAIKSGLNVVTKANSCGSESFVSDVNHAPRYYGDRLDLPKVELCHFDGNPREYWKFIRQFENYIEKRVLDDGQRLLYLINYCDGTAKKSIEQCHMLKEKGYDTARQILRELFGQSHVVSQSILDGLFEEARSVTLDGASLTRLTISLQGCEIALSQMNCEADLNALSTIERVVRLLPQTLQSRWARALDEVDERPTFARLLEFVTREARIARSRFGMIAASSSRQPGRSPITRNYQLEGNLARSFNVNARLESSSNSCYICKGSHEVGQCRMFLGYDIQNRWSHVRRNRACYACLGKGHFASTCPSPAKCHVRGCSASHHPLLHMFSGSSHTEAETANCSAVSNLSEIQLGVVPVLIEGPGGVEATYALIDSGSDVTLVEHELIERLNIETVPSRLKLSTMNGSNYLDSGVCHLSLQALDGSGTISIDRAFSVDKVSVRTSASPLRDAAARWPHLADIPFRDIPDRRVKLLIGTDVPEAHWVEEQRKGKVKEPFAVRTLLGWMILGPSSQQCESVGQVHAMSHSDEMIMAGLKRLYDSEFADTATEDKGLSTEDKIAVDVVSNSTHLINGHYEIGLPWRQNVRSAVDNRQLALRRLLTLRAKFLKEPEFFQRYAQSISQCIEKGYAEKMSECSQHGSALRWYLPHHAVLNPKKPGKFRVVFDCAAKYGGLCLNDMLYSGPDVTNNLLGVLLRFRCENVALAADIEEMFMQVKIPVAERDAFRFLWWDNDDLSGRIVECRMTVHPFGATSSPYIANYALKRILRDFSHELPVKMPENVCNHFYVDDLLMSVSCTNEAQNIVKHLPSVLQKGGFRLRKWTSNRPKVLSQLPSSELSQTATAIAQGFEVFERTLGLEWNPVSDTFRFTFNASSRETTRRGILATVASLYDPLGLIAPILLPAKLLLQRLCRQGLAWDEPVATDDADAWRSWRNQMCLIDRVKIQRCIRRGTDHTTIQLHVFCDASEVGYGAVVYSRLRLADGQSHCCLMLAKSKVAPLKPISIPRLELSAARLGARIGKLVLRSVSVSIESVTFWTDSTIVLFYIRNQRSRYCTFVSNRLSTIHDLSETSEWRYVPSKMNPADLASRGVADFESLETWLRGPEFLTRDECEWPMEISTEIPAGIEVKRVTGEVNCVTLCELSRLYDRYSDWPKLIKSVIWLTRFKMFLLRKFGRPMPLILGPLRVGEWQQAEFDVVRMVQREAFPDAFQESSSGLRSLFRLNPVLLNGMLCVGGRLSYLHHCSMRNPPIMPKGHVVTEMLIRHHHVLEGHSGVMQVLASIRKRYWIVKGAATVKGVLRKCLKCRRQLANPMKQIMAPLPPQRVEPGWVAFQYVGLDYFGPFTVKRGRSLEKRYGCIFTCLQTRAVHLEISCSLSTDSFIMSLMRFVGRRGTPREIVSDNGTNFVGAQKELHEKVTALDSHRISSKLTPLGIQWTFNPVAASHRGGVWERMIRSCRRILSSVANEQLLTDEVLYTTFVEVEMILNNRPLVSVYDDVRDPDALTPNHLLLLRGNSGLDLDRGFAHQFRKGFRQAAYLAGVFWRRWTREYLPTLQARQKWLKSSRKLRVGDLVLVCSEIGSRGRWPLGVVVEAKESNDGHVRTVVVRTSEGLLTRDVRKICWLEGDVE